MRFVYVEICWALHNLVAHPAMQVLRVISLFGLIKPIDQFGNWLHDATTPKNPPAEKRRDRVEVVWFVDAACTTYLAERLLSPAYPQSLNKLRLPGGKIEDGETPREAAIREMKEEYGLTLLPDDFGVGDDNLDVFEGPRGKVVRVLPLVTPYARHPEIELHGRISWEGHERLELQKLDEEHDVLQPWV